MLEVVSLSSGESHDLPEQRGGHKVTDLKEAARSERINVFVDNKFFCSLELAQVVDLKLKIGAILDDEALIELKQESEFSKLYNLALAFCLSRPRPEKELADYLFRKTQSRAFSVKNKQTGQYEWRLKEGFSDSISQRVSRRILERGYVDDEKFARFWVEHRNARKGESLRKLKQELAQKGVNQMIIETVFAESERNDGDELQKIIAKKRARYSDDQKFLQYLVRQGFSYHDSLEALSSLSEE